MTSQPKTIGHEAPVALLLDHFYLVELIQAAPEGEMAEARLAARLTRSRNILRRVLAELHGGDEANGAALAEALLEQMREDGQYDYARDGSPF